MNIGFAIAIVCVLIYQIIDAYSLDNDNQAKRNCRDFCKSKCGVSCNCEKGATNA